MRGIYEHTPSGGASAAPPTALASKFDFGTTSSRGGAKCTTAKHKFSDSVPTSVGMAVDNSYTPDDDFCVARPESRGPSDNHFWDLRLSMVPQELWEFVRVFLVVKLTCQNCFDLIFGLSNKLLKTVRFD